MAEQAADLPQPILGKEKAKKFLKALGSQNKYVKEQKINPSPQKERDQNKKKEEKKTPIQKARETRDEIEALKQNVKISPFKTPMPCFKDSILIHHITADMAGESSSSARKSLEFNKDATNLNHSGDTDTEKKSKPATMDAMKINSNRKNERDSIGKSEDEKKSRILPATYNLEKRSKSSKKDRSRSRDRRDRSKSEKRYKNDKKDDGKKRDGDSRKSDPNFDKANSFFLKWTKVQPSIGFIENPKTIQHIKNDLLIMSKLERKQIKRKLRMEMKREKLLKKDKEKLRRKKAKRGKNKKPDSDKSSSVEENELKKKRRKKQEQRRKRSKSKKSPEPLTPELIVDPIIVDSDKKLADVIVKSDPKSPDTDEYMSNWEDEANNCNAFSEMNLDTIPLRLPIISDRSKILIKTDEEKNEKIVQKSDADDKQMKLIVKDAIVVDPEHEVANIVKKETIDIQPLDCLKQTKPKETPQIEDLYNEYEQFIMSCMSDEKEAEGRNTAIDDVVDGIKKDLPQIHSTENDFEQSFASTDNEDQLEQLKRNLEQQIYEIDSTGRFSLDEADDEEEEERQQHQPQQQQLQQQPPEEIQPSTSSLKRKSSTSTTTSSSESTEPPGSGNAASSTSSLVVKKKRSTKKKKKRKRTKKSSLISAWSEDVPSDEELLSMVEQLKQNFMEKRNAKASKRKNKREQIDADEQRSETPPLERRLKETNKILMEQVIEPQVGMISSTNSNSLASEIINTKVTRTCKGVFPINDLALEDVAKLASDAKKMNLAASVANSKAEMEGYLNVVTIMKCDSFTINNQETCKLIDAKDLPISHVSIKTEENKDENQEVQLPKEALPFNDQVLDAKPNENIEIKEEVQLNAVIELPELKKEPSPIVQQPPQQQEFKYSDDKRSPIRKLSPRKRSISPPHKRNRTPPRKRSRSPRKRSSHSPRKRSRSPRKRSRSPRRRSRSPPRKRSRSPRKRSPSPRKRSSSPHSRRRRSRSPRPKSPPRRYSSPSRHSIRSSVSPRRKISRISSRRSNSPVDKFWSQSYEFIGACETDRFTATANTGADWQQPESHSYSDYAAYGATSQPQHNMYPSDQHQQQHQYSSIPVLDHQGSGEFFFSNMDVQQQQHHVHMSNLIEIQQSPLRPPSPHTPFALRKGNVLEIVLKEELLTTVPVKFNEPSTSVSDKQKEDDKLSKLELEKRNEVKQKKAQEKEKRHNEKLLRKEKVRQQIKQLELELATMKKKEVEIVSKRIFVYDPNAQCGKSILRCTDSMERFGKKKVSFADGKTPGEDSSSAEEDQVPIPLPLQDKMKKKLLKSILPKDQHEKGKSLVIMDNIKSYVDPELWNMPAPPPPPGSPPVQLLQPKLKKSDDSIPKLIYFHYNRFDHTMYVSPFPTLDPNQIKNQSSGRTGSSTATTSNTASSSSTTNNPQNKTQHSEAPKVCFIQPPTFPQPPPPPPPSFMQYPVPPFGQSPIPPYGGNAYPPPSPHFCGPNAPPLTYGPRPPSYMQTSPFMPSSSSPFMSPQTSPFMPPHIQSPFMASQHSSFGMSNPSYPNSPSPNMMGPFNPRQAFTPPSSRQMRPSNVMYSPTPPPQQPGQSPHRAIPPKMFDHMNKSIRHRSASPKIRRWDTPGQIPPPSLLQWTRPTSPVVRPFAGGGSGHPSPRPPMQTNFISGPRPRMSSLPFQSPLPPPPPPPPQFPYASNPSPTQHAP